MAISFGNSVNLGSGLVVHGRTDDGLDFVLYEHLESTTGRDQPRIKKVVTIAEGDISAMSDALLASFGTRTDLGQGLIVEKLDSDDAADLVFYEDLFTTRGLAEPREIRRVQVTEAKVTELTDAVFVPIDTGLWGYWPLEETMAGDSRPDSVGSNDLADLDTAITGDVGINGNAAVFTASGVLTATIAPTEFTDGITVNLWAKTTGGGSSQGQMMISTDGTRINSTVFMELSLGDQLAEFGNGLAPLNGAILLNGAFVPSRTSYHMYTMTFDAVTKVGKMYRDGVLKTSGTLTGTWFTPASSVLTVGDSPLTGPQWFGHVDELAIWSRALPVSSIVNLYNAGVGTFYPF